MIILAGVTREFEFRWRQWNIFAQEKEGDLYIGICKAFRCILLQGWASLFALLLRLEADIESTEPEDINIQHNFLPPS